MNKIIVLPIMIILTILLSAITVVFAIEKEDHDEAIYEEHADISGDQKEDSITISGTPFEEDPLFLKEVALNIKTSEGKTLKIKLSDGYELMVTLNDLNNDGVKDVFIVMEADGSIGESNHYLYSFKDAKTKELPVPESLGITSQYEDGYKASIKINNTNAAYTFDFTKMKDRYDKLGLYNEGTLNEPMELAVSPFSTLKPEKLKGDRLGLKGIQKFSGVLNGDTIGVVESSWYYKDGAWELIDTSVRSTSNSVKK